MSVFGKRLREIRKQSKLTLRKAGEIFKVSHASYLHWEQGKSEPNFATLIAICDYFDVSADFLLGRAEI